MQQVQQQAPPMNTKTMIGMFAVLIVMMVVMQFRSQIGGALDVVFKYIAFDGQYPVLTLIIAGLIMITVSTIIRSVLSDPIQMARNQQIQSDFNKEFRQARLENNLFKMKKLLPVYAWVWYFINPSDAAIPGGDYFGGDNPLSGMEHALVNIPWSEGFNLNEMLLGFFPAWIIIYTMVSMPIGQIENRLLRLYFLNKHLRKLDLEAKRAEIE